MNHDEIFRNLLTEYGTVIQVAGLEPTLEGFCAITVDDDLTVQFQLDVETGMLAFVIELGTVAEEHRAKTATFMLAANVLWMGTGGATLGMDFEGRVMLCYSEPVQHLVLERFSKIIDNLINVAEDWEENLVALRLDEVGPETLAQEWGNRGDEGLPGLGWGMRV
ncbi:type III secretion system chaperone [Verrucomicrobium sp. BvORR106]|uniref:type III secretion system chaperone n=1 Tax=Verrucomicrobium sp. BvORR106 TaxID=1403819 RepID=UPI002240FEAC|nr:type III secretion system chaperone [Verrucomicrobium sp. BvORR106]